MTVRIPNPDGESQVYTIDFRETAPALANSSMFARDPILSRRGGLSVAVPGEIRGLEEAHRRWGKLPWERLVWPSVRLAQGWEVDRELSRRITVGLRLAVTAHLAIFNQVPSSSFQNCYRAHPTGALSLPLRELYCEKVIISSRPS